jgi:deazaflavin-dependent oxidoreductase (nitroreductase family)
MREDQGGNDDAVWANERLCDLTTIGRRSGRRHTIEIWFAQHDGLIYLLSGGKLRSDWVKNIIADPAVQLRLHDHTLSGNAQLVTDPDEDALARRLLAAKYEGWSDGQPLSEWASTSTPLRIDVVG